MAVLYVGPTGRGVTRHSYSSGSTFNSCRRKYFLQKVKGWRKKERTAATEFGNAIEAAIQHYHSNGLELDSGVEYFKRSWAVHKMDKELVYKPTEKDFDNLLRAGSELLRLYEILLPSFPIVDPVFQANFTKKVFPGSHLDDLQDTGWVDLISRAPIKHPLLPDIPVTKETSRTLIVDIKTAGKELSVTRDMLRMDPQLRRYAFLSSYKDVAFLWLVKSVWDAYERGKEVTFITSSENWTAGDRAVVFQYLEEKQRVLLTTTEGLQRIKGLLAEIKGKGSTERKETLIAGLVADNDLLSASVDDITKQKIQFLACRLSDEDINEAGEQVGEEIVAIHDANERGVWRQSPGIRFPDQKCTWCEMRGICTKNDKQRDEMLIQITPADNLLDEIEEDFDDTDFGFGEE